MNFLSPDWRTIGIKNEALKFLFQRWMELLDQGTPISHQTSVAGALEVLRELQKTQVSFDETGFGLSGLVALTEEAFGVSVSPYGKVTGTVNSDPIARELIGDIGKIRDSNRRHFASGGVTKDTDRQRERALTCSLLGVLQPVYLELVVNQLEKLISKSETLTPKAIEHIDALLSSLTSELLSSGYADSFLRTHRSILESRGQRGVSESERLKIFLSRFTEPPSLVRVIFPVQSTVEFWKKWSESLAKTYKEAKEISAFPESKPGSVYATTAPNKRFVEIEVRAYDHHAASRIAYQRLQQYADLVSAGLPRNEIRVLGCTTIRTERNRTIVSITERNRLQLDPLPSTHITRSDDRELSGLSLDLINRIKDTSSRNRIHGALRYYRISLEQAWMESSLTNLWTALEAISPIDSSQNIIDRVAWSVASLMGSLKVKSMSDALVGYLVGLRLYNSLSFRRDFASVFNSENKIDPVLLMKALADEKDRERLLQLVKESPLLHFRICHFSNATENGKTLAGVVYRSTRRVEWQIRRLYRLRNEIVHGAATPTNIQRLLQHLRHYVNRSIIVVSDLLAANNGLNTIETVMAAIDSAFHVWLDEMRKTDALKDISVDQMKNFYSPPFYRLHHRVSSTI